MGKQMKIATGLVAFGVIGVFAFIGTTPSVHADIDTNSLDVSSLGVECYKFNAEDSPAASESAGRDDVWCYRSLNDPPGSRLIYAIDADGNTSPELSFLIEADGTTTHASLQAGETTVHRLSSTPDSFKPIPVPTLPPADAIRVPAPITPSSVESTNKALDFLKLSPPQTADIRIQAVGHFVSLVATTALPWRGFWFPYASGRLHNGANSPLAKFDKFIKARTGANPGAQSWEKRRHYWNGKTKWEGHCNGWAAASIMEKEPIAPWTDGISGITFTIGDQKGILMERDYCPKMAFYGSRYRGPRSNLGDIRANVFHTTITYYLGQLKKPILMDIVNTEPVENRVISGYDMTIKQLGKNVFQVKTKLTVHGYDSGLTNDVGVAPSKPREYRYKLWTDDQGNVIRGSWLSANPDFIWVPLAPDKCKDGNPAVTEARVKLIGGGRIPLPWNEQINLPINATMDPDDQAIDFDDHSIDTDDQELDDLEPDHQEHDHQ